MCDSFSMRASRAFLVLRVWLGILGMARAAGAQPAGDLPFAPGERLAFEGRVRTGIAGGGALWVEGPVVFRGASIWILHSDMEGRIGPLRASERSASWFDPARVTALRYAVHERRLLRGHDDAVEIHAGEKRWRAADGAEGVLETSMPLDELSFLYFVRTLPLPDDTIMTFARHFDRERNPTVVHVVGREEIEVGAGRFRAVLVEMRVRDARRYRGEGTIRIHLSDDRCRLILRLESRVPDAGVASLALRSYQGVRPDCAARGP